MFRVLGKYKYFLVFTLLFLFLRIPSLFEPYWYGDEGIYLTLGEGINKGLTLYSQIHDNKPPTLYFLAAIARTVFGFRLMLLLIMAPTIFAFYKLSKKFLKPKLATIAAFIFLLLTSIPLFEGHIANAEVFMLLPTILGVSIFLDAKNKKDYLISSLLLGFAFTIKIPVAFEFLLLFVLLFIDKINLLDDFSFKQLFKKIKNNFLSFVYFGTGFLLPIVLYGIYYYFQGAIQPFLVASLFQNFGYLSSWSTGTHTSSLASGGLITRFLILILAWVVIYFLAFKKIIDQKVAFILGWFAATVFSALLSARPYPHYLIQILPPFSLVIVSLFSGKFKPFKSLFLLSIAVLVFVIYHYQFYFYPVVSYYKNYYSYALRIKDKSQYYSFFGGNVNQTYQIAEYISKNTSPDQKIFIWGDEPYVYPLSNRLPVGRYTVAYHIVDFNAFEETISKFKTELPAFIIYHPMGNRSFKQLDTFIDRYYYPVTTFGSVLVFKLR